MNAQLKKMKRKSSNQLKDRQHKMSRKIVDNTRANTIIVGDLQVKKLCQKKEQKNWHGLHKAMYNTGNISRFLGYLTYKAQLEGKRVIVINERGTTRTCCQCQNKKDMALSDRTYICDCGLVLDRDRNSSINIMARYLSQNALWTSYGEFSRNLRLCQNIELLSNAQESPSERVGQVQESGRL